jgi:hypothetical protein
MTQQSLDHRPGSVKQQKAKCHNYRTDPINLLMGDPFSLPLYPRRSHLLRTPKPPIIQHGHPFFPTVPRVACTSQAGPSKIVITWVVNLSRRFSTNGDKRADARPKVMHKAESLETLAVRDSYKRGAELNTQVVRRFAPCRDDFKFGLSHVHVMDLVQRSTSEQLGNT